MATFKRRVFRVAVLLFFAAIILTLVSSTIYRLNWPQISTATITSGKLDNSYKFRSTIVPSREDIGTMGLPENLSETDQQTMKLRCGTYLSLTFGELILIKNYTVIAEVVVIAQNNGITSGRPVLANLTFVDTTYNPATGKFDVYYVVDPKAETFPGHGITVTYTYASESLEFEHMVPLSCVFYDSVPGYDFYLGAYIYAVKQQHTMWGITNYVRRIPVQVLGSDYQYTAISLPEGEVVPELIASNPSGTLRDGASVMLKETADRTGSNSSGMLQGGTSMMTKDES